MDDNRIIIIDDEPELGRFVATVAEDCGYETFATTAVEEFQAQVRNWSPTHIALDLQMPGTDGVELLRFLAEERSTSRIVIMSGVDRKIIESARRLGTERGLSIAGALSKPIRAADLQSLLEEIKVGPRISAAALEQAMERGELVIHLQPKVTLGNGIENDRSWDKAMGFEALVRWQHPTWGLIPPMEFIPLAEANGLMGRLTATVFDLALEALSQWSDIGIDLSVAVNVSAENLMDLAFADMLAEKCAAAGVEPSQIIIEVTETSAMRDMAAAMDILTRLRLKGFKLSMDDFGTGYSSLVQLHRMPFSELKIDRTFLKDGLEADEDRTIVKTMIDLAHNLGLSIVAEGVESLGLLRSLRDMGCDIAQGFGIARPMATAKAGDWLEQNLATQ